MLLEAWQDASQAQAIATQAHALMTQLFPICRSITGPGLRQSLDMLAEWAPMQRSEVPSGTTVLDWEVPDEWSIRDAFVKRAGSDERVIDFRAHNLHVVSHSVPVRARLTRAELEPHLHSLPEQPHLIPNRTSYYERSWGFCLRHEDRLQLGEGPFDVVIDSSLASGHLSYGECTIAGHSSDEVLVFTHCCHPSLANDNLSGMVLAAALARALGALPEDHKPRLSWRFVFAPGTIGSITWLARNQHRLGQIRAGLVLGLLGDAAPLTYKSSRRGDTLVDRAASLVVRAAGGHEMAFEPYGYDERQFCSPGFDLPVGRLTRSVNGAYPEYHNSGDDLSFVTVPALAHSLQALGRIVRAIDGNQRFLNLSPMGEPQLGRRGLYGLRGGAGAGELQRAMLWVLNQSDGRHDLLHIAQSSGLAFELLEEAAQALIKAGLLAVHEGPALAPSRHLTRGLYR